ncbi:MAG: ATP:cob(I)alamin adenosyltransferase [Erysipelotrichaceae bacterium]
MNEHLACAYPFLKEESKKCDFEIESDLLVSQLGVAIPLVQEPLKGMLMELAEMIYHLNGSIRGKVAVSPCDVERLFEMHETLALMGGRATQFVLPVGCAGASALHVARCIAKKVTRLAYQIEREQVVDPLVITIANMVANLLFSMALVANAMEQVEEIGFVSKSYGN